MDSPISITTKMSSRAACRNGTSCLRKESGKIRWFSRGNSPHPLSHHGDVIPNKSEWRLQNQQVVLQQSNNTVTGSLGPTVTGSLGLLSPDLWDDAEEHKAQQFCTV
jgi:hypothetical protein